jgi:hypothetical protein
MIALDATSGSDKQFHSLDDFRETPPRFFERGPGGLSWR